MHRLLKQFLLKTLPGPAEAVQAYRRHKHVQRIEERLGLPEIAQAYVARHGLRVSGGPFAGMPYVPSAAGSAFIPKLLGSYEAELHSLIAELLSKDYDTVVDVGCAEGYYAVGLARHLPEARVFAFDTDAAARRLCRSMAQANDVQERVTVAGRCDADTLDRLITERTLVICDCEGYETELLCPHHCPRLVNADVLVELHSNDEFGDTAMTVLDRFRVTHTVGLITSIGRDPDHHPELAFLPPSQRAVAVNEYRAPGQQWAFLEAETAVSKKKRR